MTPIRNTCFGKVRSKARNDVPDRDLLDRLYNECLNGLLYQVRIPVWVEAGREVLLKIENSYDI